MALFRSQLVLAPTARIVYALSLADGQTYESLFKPEIWAPIARDIPKGTIIEVTAHDGSWWAELLVRAASTNEVVVAELRKVDFDGIEERNEGEYDIVWAGRAKFRVIRKADKQVMVSGLETREKAEAWIKAPVEEAA